MPPRLTIRPSPRGIGALGCDPTRVPGSALPPRQRHWRESYPRKPAGPRNGGDGRLETELIGATSDGDQVMPFSERDWKHLRTVHGIALERFCTNVLDDAVAIVQDGGLAAHERYLQLFDLLHERNAAMASAFDDMRRSTGLQRLIAMVSLNVLTREELDGFNPDVQETARELSQVISPRRSGAPRRRRQS